jgi:hypothetical protein
VTSPYVEFFTLASGDYWGPILTNFGLRRKIHGAAV